MIVIADFETANTAGIDLKEVGSEVYARHPATEILCLCIISGSGRELIRWQPGQNTDLLAALARDPAVTFEAHNAAFEQMIWHHIMVPRYGLPELPIQRWCCTMAQSMAHGLPAALDKIVTALQLPDQKDAEGRQITLSLSAPITKKDWNTPQSEGGWRPDDWFDTQKTWADLYEPIYDRRPKTLERVARYCMQDCAVELAVRQVVPELSDYERAVWLSDQVINQRGVRIDRPFVESAIKVTDDARPAAETRFAELTGGLAPGQVAKVVNWVRGFGVDLPDLQKGTIDQLLGAEDDEERSASTLPPEVIEALELRRLLAGSAVKKYPRMLECAGEGDRMRYLLQYHGAGTGRWAGRLVQPQNFPRASVPDFDNPDRNLDADTAVSIFRTGSYQFVEDLFGMSAIKAAGRVLRHTLIPNEGRVFCCGDYAGIEMRIVLALAGQHDKCELLATGQDVYLDMASQIFGCAVTKAEVERRQIGKNTVLGCGFGMGWEKFRQRYCPNQPEDFARQVVESYRKVWAPRVQGLWYGLERAALQAVEGGFGEFNGVIYQRHDRWLVACLPDGQCMWYTDPEPCLGKFGGPSWRFKTWKEGRWQTVNAYGGLLTENVVQKLARGLLVEAIIRLEQNGFPVVLTVHDEILAEPPAGADQKAFEQIMAERPGWAVEMGIPVAVEGWTGGRYRK